MGHSTVAEEPELPPPEVRQEAHEDAILDWVPKAFDLMFDDLPTSTTKVMTEVPSSILPSAAHEHSWGMLLKMVDDRLQPIFVSAQVFASRRPVPYPCSPSC